MYFTIKRINKGLKPTIDKAPFDEFLKAMSDEKIFLGDAEKRFMKEIIEPLFDPNGVSFSQLNNIRIQLNSKFKDLQSPTFKDYIKGQVGKALREAVDKGINDIFRQNPAAYAKVKQLYDTALREYSTMKDIQTIIKKHNFYKQETDFADDLDKLVNFIIKGKGDEKTPNLERLLSSLTPQNRAVAEVNILKQLLDNTKIELKQQFGRGQTRTYFTWDFIDKLDALAKKDNIFKSQAAKDMIKVVKDWHLLNKNHADILMSLRPADVKEVRQGIATRIQGRLEQMRTNLLISNIFRLLDKLPFANSIWEKTQAGALRFHIKNALSNSVSIDDFKSKLTQKLDTGNFNNETKNILREIIGEADNAQKALNELDKAEMELARKSDDELVQMDKSLGRGTPQPNSNESVTQQSLNKAEIKPKNSAETKLLNEIDPSSLNDEQKAVFEVLTGQKDKIILQGKNLNDLYILERGTRQGGARKIITKHGGVEKTGGLSNDEILDMMKVVREGELDENSFTQHKDFIRYAYDLKDENGLNLRLVVDEYNDGKKVFDFYSNRNFTDYDGQSWQKNENIQMPKKSLLEQARENTERLRAEQEAAQIAQKEAELARLKEMQAKNAEILAQKEAAAGQAINEAQNLEIGTPIKAHKISDTKIIINDNTAPFKAEFIIAKKDDIKPNFERTGTQGRSQRQDKVIESIQSDFKPHLIFEQMGGFEGLPIILKDGQVIAGNHRAQAIKGLTGENLARYKQAAKEKFGVDLKDDEVIVRLVKDGDEKELINLAFMSNVGRESNIGEKALANLAKYESNMQNLPNHINADSVFELESQVAKALDTQGNGLNVFDTNLALFSRLAKNSSNTDILESLNTLKSLSQDEKEKVLRMFVSNAGEFHNLAKDTELKNLNLNDYLADALIIAAKNVDEKTRKANFQSLFSDIQTMLASAKEMLKIDPFLFENFKSKALGYALARFARLENPAGKLFDFLKASKADLENLYTGGLFDTNKAISDIDIYDFLKHAINSGDDLMDNGVNLKHAITSKLDDLRKVENALIDSGDIQFAKSKAKPQGREAKETNINSLFADDELQMQATKPAKELNLSDEKDFNELSEFFKLNSKDKEFNEIYDKAATAAQRLGVKVRFDESAARSHFVLNDNTITIAAGNKELFQAQDLLHELIHATTRKALKDFSQSPEQAAKIYTKRQIEAIKEINSLYLKSKGIAKRQGKDAYALQNVDEFVAELSSSEFRAFLKAQDIFERFIKALIRFFTGDSERLAKNVNSYKALKESYYKILDDYEPPLVEKSVLDKNSEPQLAANLSSDEILANSKMQSQAENSRSLKEKLNDEVWAEHIKELNMPFDNKTMEVIKIEYHKGIVADEVLLNREIQNKLKSFDRRGDIKGKEKFLNEEIKDFGKDIFYYNLNFRRQKIERELNINPLKEFGTNYAEFYRDGQGAVKKLLAEKQGQVAGAFYRDDLAKATGTGEIDLVWGDSTKGLQHILERRVADFETQGLTKEQATQKALWFVENDLNDIITNGNISFSKVMNRVFFDTDTQKAVIALDYDGKDRKWILTAFNKNDTASPRPADMHQSEAHGVDFSSSSHAEADEIIPNSSSQSQGKKEFLSPNSENVFTQTTPEQRNQIVKGIQGEIDELVKASYEIDGKIKQIAKVANERAEITGRYSRTSDEIKAIDALNKESEKLEKEVYKLQTLQDFFKGDLSNDFWEFLHNFNNEKALKWYEKEINKRVKSVSGDETQKVSHEVSHINQNNAIMSEISHKGGQDGTSNASNGLNAAEKGMPASEPAGISDGLFSQKQLLDEPRGTGADLSNSAADRQQPQTLFSQGASEPNASGGQQRGSNERLRTASGDLRGEVSGDGQNLQAQQGHNVSERFGQDRSEQHSRAKHTIRANSSSGTSHSNATATQELVSDTNAAGILSPAEKATIENQTFTQTIDPAKFNANEILSANILTKNYDKEHLNELIDAGNDIVRLAQLAKNGNKTAERILQNYHTEAVGRGYSGYSMSVNAVEAQENGVKPLSKFNAKDAKEVSEILNEKISTNELKNLLSNFGDTGEWHHTSKFYNKTPHYSIAEMFLNLDKVKNRLALKKNAEDIIKTNTQLYNDYISQIDKATEFIKNAKDIDKSWVLSWFRDRKRNAKDYLGRQNKFGTKAEFDVINEVFKVKTLENHPQFNALFIQQNKENLQNLAKISSGNLEKGQDLDLKNRTLQEIMLKNEKIINYAFLKQIADDLPPALSKDEFIKALAPNAKGRANIKTPIKDIEINAEQAWEHLLDNSKGEDRTKISGGLLQTLQKPFFVTKNDEGSYYFYKPFKDERGILNLISIEVPKAARLKYKTSYIADKNKMLELINKHELVYKSW